MGLSAKVGTRLRMVRIDKHYTLKEIADMTGISFSAISKYEYGDRIPSEKTLAKICETLHIYENWLLYGVDRKTNPSATPIYRKTPISRARRLQKAGVIRNALRNGEIAKSAKQALFAKKNKSKSRGKQSPVRSSGGSCVSNETGETIVVR